MKMQADRKSRQRVKNTYAQIIDYGDIENPVEKAEQKKTVRIMSMWRIFLLLLVFVVGGVAGYMFKEYILVEEHHENNMLSPIHIPFMSPTHYADEIIEIIGNKHIGDNERNKVATLLSHEKEKYESLFKTNRLPVPEYEKPYLKIVIFKNLGILAVMTDEKLYRIYPAQTGSAHGQKNVSGDMKTPEGTFYIAEMRPCNNHLCMLLSWPNIGAAIQGVDNNNIGLETFFNIVKQNYFKKIPFQHSTLGGQIMIHGRKRMRAGEYTGTAGCIALTDADIEDLFNVASLKMPVHIIEGF